MDNIKGILIIFVVVGHSLELIMGNGMERFLYVLIYSFHMPLFVYTTGYFANFHLKKILKNLCYPYVMFQTLYLLFAHFVLKKNFSIHYEKPYWILWYLFAAAIWTIILAVIERYPLWLRVIVLGSLLLFSIASGYVNAIGRSYSLSRIIVFFPFFLLGYEMHYRKGSIKAHLVSYKKEIKTLCILGVLCAIVCCLWNYQDIHLAWLYEANSYVKGGYSILFRMSHFGIALLFIAAAQLLTPNRMLRGLTYVGQHTMPIYLFHGFIIKWVDMNDIIQKSSAPLLGALLLSVICICLLSAKPTLSLIDPVFHPGAFLRKCTRQKTANS